MSYTLILNSNNVNNINNTEYKYNFINGSFYINEGSQICVSQIVIPYSWFNVNNGYYNNATLSYIFGNNTYNVTFPDGFYTTEDLNKYLQLYMVNQNQYLYNISTGLNMYFIEIIVNVTYYSNQLLFTPIPKFLPDGYSTGSTVINGYTYSGFNVNPTTCGLFGYNGNVFSQTGYTPQIIINSNISTLIGFSKNTYPSVQINTYYNILSNITPNSTQVNSIIIRSNIVNNPCCMPSDILDSFSINNTFGSNITYTPYYEKWVNIKSGNFANLTILLQDQNFNAIEANDNNILISLLLKQGPIKEKTIENSNIPLLKQLTFKDEEKKSSLI